MFSSGFKVNYSQKLFNVGKVFGKMLVNLFHCKLMHNYIQFKWITNHLCQHGPVCSRKLKNQLEAFNITTKKQVFCIDNLKKLTTAWARNRLLVWPTNMCNFNSNNIARICFFVRLSYFSLTVTPKKLCSDETSHGLCKRSTFVALPVTYAT